MFVNKIGSLFVLLVAIYFSIQSHAETCEEGKALQIKMTYDQCEDFRTNNPPDCSPTGNGIASVEVENLNNGTVKSCVSRYCDGQLNGYLNWLVLYSCENQPPPPSNPPSGPPGSGGPGGPPSCKGACCDSGAGGVKPDGVSAAGAPGSTLKTGSIVSVEAQSLGEIIPVAGASFSMYYYSAYQAGRSVDFKVQYAISGDTPRDYITGFGINLTRGAGTADTAAFGNTLSNQTYSYTWNGLDPSNTSPVDSAKFTLTVNEISPAGTFPMVYDFILSHWNAKKLGLGGWLPTNLYHYDVLAKRLYAANGDYRNVEAAAYGTSQLYLASENGQEVYIFDAIGNHLYTKTGLLGTIVLTFAYDTSGRLTSITEPFSKVTAFNRDLSGNITSITAPNGQVTSIGLDANGYLSTVTNPNSEIYTVAYYGTQGLMYTFQKPNGEVSTFEYTADGLLTKDSHSGGYFFELVKAVNSNVTYDITLTTTMGRASSVRTNVGSDGSVAQTQTSPSGATYTSNFTVSGASYTRSDSGGGYTTNIYSSVDPRFGSMSKAATQYDFYPSGGNSRIVTSTDSVVLSDPADPFSISSMSNVKQLSGANTTLTSSFDPIAKKFTSSTYLGKTDERIIDSYERTVSFKEGSLNPTVLNYTGDALTSVTQGTRTTAYSYNALGLLEAVTNPLSQTTSYIYDSANRIHSKVFPDSRVVGYSYDGVGNVTGVTPPGRPMHIFGINSHGLVGSYQPPTLSGVTTVNTAYTYNLDKQLTSVTRPSGDYISYNYNASTAVLESLDTLLGTYTLGIDVNTGLLNSITTPNNIAMNIGYVGSVMAGVSTYVSGVSVGSYNPVYGAYNHVDSDTVTSGGSGSTTSSIAYLYNDDEILRKAGDVVLAYNTPNGQLTGTTMGSGTTGFTDIYTYNTYGEVTSYQAKRGTAIIYDMTLSRDGVGRVNSKTQTMNSITNVLDYVFDNSGRLTQVSKNAVVASNYGYDSNSNRSSGNIGSQTTNATYDDQDRLLTYNALSFTYNANGDLATKTNSTTGQMTTYSYDVFGNLTQVVLPGGATTITYEIDGLNRRIGKKVNGVVQKRWVYMDQYRIAAELNSSGTITKRFIYGSKENIPDYMIASGVKYRIISDQLGSPRLVVKQSDGTILQRMDHDEFGRIAEDTNPGYLPFGFAGGLYDSQTGLVRFGSRDYDSETGRWLGKDPILFDGDDVNLFGYVAQDPANSIDPSGLYQFCTRRLKWFPDYHWYLCVPNSKGGVTCGGQGPSGMLRSAGKNDSSGGSCQQGPQNKCVDGCLLAAVSSNARPKYSLINSGGGMNCQAWVADRINWCTKNCAGK